MEAGVSTRVNNPQHDSPDVPAPAESGERRGLG